MSDLFPDLPVEESGKKRVRTTKSEKIPEKKTGARPGVCECGSGKFRLSISAGVMTRTCKNEKCKKQVIV